MESLSDPTAVPLRIWRQERFAQLRSLGLPSLEAAREAGYTHMSPENTRKLANKRHVLARVAHLRKQDTEVLAERRDIVADRQWLWHEVDIGDYYEDAAERRFDQDGHMLTGPDGKPVMRHYQRLKPLSALTREQRLRHRQATEGRRDRQPRQGTAQHRRSGSGARRVHRAGAGRDGGGLPLRPSAAKGERSPVEVIGAAVKVMRIVAGEEPEDSGPAPE